MNFLILFLNSFLKFTKTLLSSGYIWQCVCLIEGDSSSYMLFEGILEEGVALATEVLIRSEEEDAVLALMFTANEIKAMIDPAGYTGLCSLIAEEMAGKANGKAAELKK